MFRYYTKPIDMLFSAIDSATVHPVQVTVLVAHAMYDCSQESNMGLRIIKYIIVALKCVT